MCMVFIPTELDRHDNVAYSALWAVIIGWLLWPYFCFCFFVIMFRKGQEQA